MIVTPHVETRYRGKGFLTHVIFDQDGEFMKAGGGLIEDLDGGFLIRYFKRIIGLTFDEIQEEMKKGERFLNEYKDIIEMGKGGKTIIRLAQNRYTPERIVAIFLKEISIYAEEMSGEEMEKAIIAIPSYFDHSRRKAMMTAGGMVFKSVELVEEPLAAILGCELDAEARERPMIIFDLGVGDLQITIAKVGCTDKGKPTLVPMNEMVRLRKGGIDMDYAILEYLMERNRHLRDIFPASPPKERRRFLWLIEEAKIALSSRSETRVKGFIGGEMVDEELTNKEFGKLIMPIIKDCEDALVEALEKVGLGPKEVSHLILVGGPTRMPAIREMLKGIFKDNERVMRMLKEKGRTFGIDPWPMEIVAKGAAAWHGIDYRVVSVEVKKEALPGVPYTYGFFYDNVGVIPLIHKGDAFGEEGTIRRETTVIFPRPDGQIPVIQRDEVKGRPSYYNCLGIFNFFLPPQESYEMKLILEVGKEGGLRLIGRHYVVGEVVYPHILTELPDFQRKMDEETLRKEIHRMMMDEAGAQNGFYALMDSDAAKRCAEEILMRLSPYSRIPEIRDMSNRLADALYQLKRVTEYAASRLVRQIENRTAILLNRVAEAAFALLRYELIPIKDYKDVVRRLHEVYRLTIREERYGIN